MGQWIGYGDGYDVDGHPRSIGMDELHTDTTHPQGTTAASIERDYVGSSTIKRMTTPGDPTSRTNVPSDAQEIIPNGATVTNGVISI
jgi:hypothetical protein